MMICSKAGLLCGWQIDKLRRGFKTVYRNFYLFKIKQIFGNEHNAMPMSLKGKNENNSQGPSQK